MSGGKADSHRIDPITQQVIRNGLLAAVEEMRVALVKTAYNPLIYEVQDFAVALLTRDAEIMAQGASLPLFLACFPFTIRHGLEKYGLTGFQEGDVLIASDPYTTGTHISDTAVYAPIFCDGELQAFSVNMAHWADIGGKSPGGWCPDTTDVLQEGMVFPHLKLYEAGQINQTLMDFIQSNVRFPKLVMGDLNAQIAACRTGVSRYRAVADKQGADTVLTAMQQVFDQSERLVRRMVSGMPDGKWKAESCLDHDGVITNLPRKICVTVEISGGEMTVDLAGTDETAEGPVNIPLPGARGAIEIAFKSVTVPHEPSNAGHTRPLKVVAPEHSITNPSWPAPCDCYGYVALILTDLVSEALSMAVPERCPAGEYMLFSTRLFRINPLHGKPFIFINPQCGGGGALPNDDGADGLIFHGDGDAPNTPVEMAETRYPIRIVRYQLHTEEYGIGKYRGGLGTIRDYQLLTDNVFIQINNEQTICRPHGLFGGQTAGINKLWVNPGQPEERTYQQRVSWFGPFHSGTVLSCRTAGGAGWGNPLERNPERVCTEVMNGILTAEQALACYGVVLGQRESEVILDQSATEALRSQRMSKKSLTNPTRSSDPPRHWQ